jgi:signal transduction histidine kinase
VIVAALSAFPGCQNKDGYGEENARGAPKGLDTARIEQALREYFQRSPEGGTLPVGIVEEAIAMGYNDRVCQLFMDFARYQADQGNLDSTRHYYELARLYCHQPLYDKTLPASFLTEYGAFYHSLRSDNVAANNSYYEALNYLRANNLTRNKITIGIYLYLFATQEHLGNPEQALQYLKEAEKLAIELDVRNALISVRTNLGNYYSERKNYEEARKYFDLALANEDSVWNPDWDPNILIAALVGKASIRVKTGKAAEAVPLLERAVKFARDNNIIYSEVAASIDLGGAYNKLGRYHDAIGLVSHVLRAQGEQFNWYKEEGYQVLMDAFEGLGQYKQALDYQRKLHAFNDSLVNVEKTVALNALELKYQAASKDKDIASKKLVIEQQKTRLSRTNTLIAVISGVALLAVVILVFLYKNAAQKQNLQALEIKTLKRQQEIGILKSTMQGEEQERKRLSRELHDGIGSMLSSAIMQLSLLKKREPGTATPADYNDVLHLLQETGREVRKTAQNMMPDIIDKLTLPEAIKTYCDTIAQASSVDIEVQFYGDTAGFSSNVKLVIYRIVQELVHNIIKHAQATQVIVQGMLNEDNFTITVEDNGVGFDTTTPKKGMGLRNVESRVRSLHGNFEIESTPGKGTTVYMEFSHHDLLADPSS